MPVRLQNRTCSDYRKGAVMRKPASCVLSIALSLVMTVGFIPSPALAEIASAPEPAAQSAGKPNESPAETTSGQARANDQISAASGTNVTANATQPIDASMFSIEDTDIRYTGNPVMPTVTSSTVPSDQYTVAYENNVAIGQATAVVTADDQNYSGTCAIPFEIKPANAAANYQHSTTAQSGDITLTVQWNDPRLGQETTFHVTATGGSGAYQFRMDAPTYMDPDGSSESVADPSRNQWQQYTGECTSHDYQFEMTASGTYYLRFYLMDKAAGVYYLRSNVFASANDDAYPAVSAIVKSAVDKCSADTDGSDYARALWLHDWTLDQLEYDHSLNWCSAESGLTRHQGTCESYQRIYSKLLDAAGIANGRITGNGHTWNAVKIDGKWCQMDLTWDDTSDNWYGDLDQRHLYFGLTDELMAIAHSDHTANCQKDSYAYRSTDLSNNYFVRNGKADEWAEKYADRIQQHLDAREESFSIDADNQSFPPSISGIQNGIVAYAMNLRDWKAGGAEVELDATSDVTEESNSQWSVKYNIQSDYKDCTKAVLHDGRYCITSVLDPAKRLSASTCSSTLTQEVVVFSFTYEKDYGCYRITNMAKSLGSRGTQIMLLESSDSKEQLWQLESSGANWTIRNLETNKVIDDKWMQTSDGSPIWLYEYNNSPAQSWSLIPIDKSSDRSISDGSYKLSSSLNREMGISLSEGSFVLSSSPIELEIEYKPTSNLYAVSTGNKYLASVDDTIAQTNDCSSLNALWVISKSNGMYTLTNAATGKAVDDKWLDTKEGAEIWLYEPNGSIAQQWIATDGSPFEQPIPNGRYIIGSTLQTDMYIKCSEVGTFLSSIPDGLDFSFDNSSGAYYITFDEKYLASDNGLVLLSKKNGAANQLWKLSKTGECWTIAAISDGRCLDDKWLETSEGSTVWLYEPNGSFAQIWRLLQIE